MQRSRSTATAVRWSRRGRPQSVSAATALWPFLRRGALPRLLLSAPPACTQCHAVCVLHAGIPLPGLVPLRARPHGTSVPMCQPRASFVHGDVDLPLLTCSDEPSPPPMRFSSACRGSSLECHRCQPPAVHVHAWRCGMKHAGLWPGLPPTQLGMCARYG